MRETLPSTGSSVPLSVSGLPWCGARAVDSSAMDGSLCVDDVLAHLRADLAEARSGWEEACEAGLVLAAKYLERALAELKAKIAALEESA